jgi:hypothetical protein
MNSKRRGAGTLPVYLRSLFAGAALAYPFPWGLCFPARSRTLVQGMERLAYGSTFTPRQKATYPLMLLAAGLGSG